MGLKRDVQRHALKSKERQSFIVSQHVLVRIMNILLIKSVHIIRSDINNIRKNFIIIYLDN